MGVLALGINHLLVNRCGVGVVRRQRLITKTGIDILVFPLFHPNRHLQCFFHHPVGIQGNQLVAIGTNTFQSVDSALRIFTLLRHTDIAVQPPQPDRVQFLLTGHLAEQGRQLRITGLARPTGKLRVHHPVFILFHIHKRCRRPGHIIRLASSRKAPENHLFANLSLFHCFSP